MQWLIDIIKEWVAAQGYLTTSFVDRGDPAAYDYAQANFTKDDAWHDLDLSAIVPAGAQGVTLHLIMQAAVVGKSITLKKGGQVNTFNKAQMLNQVANIFILADVIVAVDTDRKIQYLVKAGVYTRLDLTVKGWWL